MVRVLLAGLLVWLMALGVVPNRAVYMAISDAAPAARTAEAPEAAGTAEAPLPSAEDGHESSVADEGTNDTPSESGDDPDPSGDDDDDNVETDELCDRDLPMVAPRIGRSAWLVFEADTARQAYLRVPEKFPSAG